MKEVSYVDRLQDWAWGGIDFEKQPEEGGLECYNHTTFFRRAFDTLAGVLIPIVSLLMARSLERQNPDTTILTLKDLPHPMRPMRLFLLVCLCLTFGMELAFKFVSRSVIYVLFPCHAVSIIWIILLASPSTPFTVGLFRFTVHVTHGTLLAIFFPIDEVLKLPFEREVYWIQHALILLVPIYMICCESDNFPLPVSSESTIVLSWSWVYFSSGIWCLYHFLVMQTVSLLTMVNIGHMLCPSYSDPLAGPNYRLIGIFHQFLCTIISSGLARACLKCAQHFKSKID